MIDKDILRSLLKNPKENGNHFIADCVFCGKEKHFYISWAISRKGIEQPFDCKKCGRVGNIISFLKQIKRMDLLEGRQVNRKQIDLSVGLNKESEEIQKELEDKKLPIGFKPCVYGEESEARNYLIDRKWQEEEFDLYQPGISKVTKFKNYVLIPVENNFAIKGFVGRYIGEDEDQPRYKNSNNTEFARLIFGLDEITNKTKDYIITEGIFDKTAVARTLNLYSSQVIKSGGSFGKKISPDQLLLLRKTNIQNLIFLWDSRDAVKEMKKAGYLAKKYFNVYVGYTGKKDPNESSDEEIFKIFDNLETIDQFFRNKVQVPKLK